MTASGPKFSSWPGGDRQSTAIKKLLAVTSQQFVFDFAQEMESTDFL